MLMCRIRVGVRVWECMCVREQSFGIAWRPVGNADSICGGLGLADQMVFMIGSYQFQGDLTHRKTETTEWNICVCYMSVWTCVCMRDHQGSTVLIIIIIYIILYKLTCSMLGLPACTWTVGCMEAYESLYSNHANSMSQKAANTD